ncbi:MAG: serine/threonine protein kinase, partial [Cyanobacteria bacterium]|nr:serine/threonine protein kinase [Cyanobacteriota bacterium]
MNKPELIAARYQVKEKLGEGAMGEVYSAFDPVLGIDVAIKVLARFSQDAARRFQQEARVSAKLSHLNIVTVIDFGLSDGKAYMVSELLSGMTLDERISRHGPLEPDEVVSIFLDICAGLDHAHATGVVHRDLKPSNIMLLEDNGLEGPRLKIIDFGLAKFKSLDQSLTTTGCGVGTPPYMSPEQIKDIALDEKSDIYSIGCVMFESLTGSPPFVGETALETVHMHLNNVPPGISQRSGKPVPKFLESAVSLCLLKDSAGRPTASELQSILIAGSTEELADGENSSTDAEESATRKSNATKHLKAAVVTLLVIGILSTLAVFLLQMTGKVETVAKVKIESSKLFKDLPDLSGRFMRIGDKNYRG